MKRCRFLRFAIPLALALGIVACDDDDDVTGSRGSLARVSVDAPGSATSGVEFEVDVSAENVGFSNVRNAQVTVDFPAPLRVFGVDATAGTNASFSNDLSGGRVFWDLGTLDSNSQSRLTVRTIGLLAPGQGSTRVTIQASLAAQEIRAGDAIARDDVTIDP
jgi:hypothetical protein